jgi:hypothetical protein
MEVTGDSIAEAVLERFNSLPKKRKPIQRADHRREWVPLAGIVAEGVLTRDRRPMMILTRDQGKTD